MDRFRNWDAYVQPLAGEPVLRFFDIGLPAFRITGGLLLLLMGMSMLRVSDDRSRHTPEEDAESRFVAEPLPIVLFSALIFSVNSIVWITLLKAPHIVAFLGQPG